MWSNFHTHNHYCDGTGGMAGYVHEAVRSGIRYLGFSSHAPLPFHKNWCMKAEALPKYLDEIALLKEQSPQLEPYKGLEVDFIPGRIGPRDFSPLLDYTIGSIHFVDHFDGNPWEIDNTLGVFEEGLQNIFNGDIRKAITRYYRLTRQMVETSPPDILGHLDKIKINSAGRFFDESEEWYRDQVDQTLEVVRNSRVIVEVNTRGLYKKKSTTPYPSPWILERIHALKIPVTLSSDAHHAEDLSREFIPALDLLREVGFKTLSVLKAGQWTQNSLDDYGSF